VETTPIGDTGLEASRIGLGTWAIGGWMWGGSEEEGSLRTIEAALDAGITLVDTAPVYGHGRSEELVGKALERSGRRDQVVLATKVGLEWDGDEVWRNGTRGRVQAEIRDSLRRLRTDRIDLYQVHWPDLETPVEETAEAMAELLDRGLIQAVGVSNFSPAQMERFRAVCPLHASQPPFNLFERGAEEVVLPYGREHGITSLTYGALCRGLLTGKMEPDTTFPDDDLRSEDPKFQPPRYARYLEAVDRLDALARERHDTDVLHLAVRWLLDHPGVGIALWGARRPEQVEPVPEMFGWSLDASDKEAIDRILDETIRDPVGPEFMAPPETREVR
jgi:aryl-alcohol dehydrogenase-like predicted oxidoreductase